MKEKVIIGVYIQTKESVYMYIPINIYIRVNCDILIWYARTRKKTM